MQSSPRVPHKSRRSQRRRSALRSSPTDYGFDRSGSRSGLLSGVDSTIASDAGFFLGINTPAACRKRRSQVSHSPSVHCGLRQSNSQRASSSGTSSTICRRTQSQIFRGRFMPPPRPFSAPPADRETSPAPPCRSAVLMLETIVNMMPYSNIRYLSIPRQFEGVVS